MFIYAYILSNSLNIKKCLQDLDSANQDTKMYITELKEHVILHKDRESIGIAEGDEIVETGEYDESVQHLIIDGQVSHLIEF